jgi:quinol monooxygenase YgiN
MIVDLSVVEVRSGREEAFAEAFHAAWKKLGKVKGLGKWQLVRCVERPTRFVFYGEWKSIQDHQALAKTPGYGNLLAAIGPYLEGSPEILHYTPIKPPRAKK